MDGWIIISSTASPFFCFVLLTKFIYLERVRTCERKIVGEKKREREREDCTDDAQSVAKFSVIVANIIFCSVRSAVVICVYKKNFFFFPTSQKKV